MRRSALLFVCVLTSVAAPSASALDIDFAPAEYIHGPGIASTQVLTTADLDGDGDLDVVAGGGEGNGQFGIDSAKLLWFENLDGAGTLGVPRVIDRPRFARAITAGDLDGDGDVDLLRMGQLSTFGGGWYENLGGGVEFAKRTLLYSFASAQVIGDVDGDGLNDLVVARINAVDGGLGGGATLVVLRNALGAGGTNPFPAITTIRAEPNGITDLELADFDDDGDLDLLHSTFNGGGVVGWLENDGLGNFGTDHVFNGNTEALFARAVDMDGDLDLDVLTSSVLGRRLVWLRNVDGAGTLGSGGTVVLNNSQTFDDGAAVDVDGDGDTDVVGRSIVGAGLTWYRNVDGAGVTFEDALPLTGLFGPTTGNIGTITPADLDEDGAIDVLAIVDGEAVRGDNVGGGAFAASRVAEKRTTKSIVMADVDGDLDLDLVACVPPEVVWQENLGGAFGAFAFGPQQLIAGGVSPAQASQGRCVRTVAVGDVDGDLDLDVVSDEIATWYENVDGLGAFDDGHVIGFIDEDDNGSERAEGVTLADFDDDGDLDVAVGLFTKFAWYRNLDGQGTFSASILIANETNAAGVTAGDIDGDGDADLVGAGKTTPRVRWFRNENFASATFATFTETIFAGSPSSVDRVRLADLDGDTDLDVLIASSTQGGARVFENDANGTCCTRFLTGSDDFQTGGNDIVTDDVDNDGDVDLVRGAGVQNRPSWSENLPTGGFTAFSGHFGAVPQLDEVGSDSVVVADLDEDGDRDWIVGGFGIQIFENLGALNCVPLPCENGGACTEAPATAAGYTCACVDGFSGVDCETNINECAPNPCDNGGVCTDGVADYTCACADGFAGDDCEINVDECAPNPCLNGGTCSDGVGTDVFTCDCPPGFFGGVCEIDLDDCSDDPCLNGGTCVDDVNGFTCDCLPGFNGVICEIAPDACDPNPCANGGVCLDDDDGPLCVCVPGFDGAFCENDIDDCGINPCLNGGACIDGVNSATCDCLPGFTGAACKVVGGGEGEGEGSEGEGEGSEGEGEGGEGEGEGEGEGGEGEGGEGEGGGDDDDDDAPVGCGCSTGSDPMPLMLIAFIAFLRGTAGLRARHRRNRSRALASTSVDRTAER